MGEVAQGATNLNGEKSMKRNTLFDNTEVEGYTNSSNVKMWILAIAVFAGAVFVGYIMNILPQVITYLDVFAK